MLYRPLESRDQLRLFVFGALELPFFQVLGDARAGSVSFGSTSANMMPKILSLIFHSGLEDGSRFWVSIDNRATIGLVVPSSRVCWIRISDFIGETSISARLQPFQSSVRASRRYHSRIPDHDDFVEECLEPPRRVDFISTEARHGG